MPPVCGKNPCDSNMILTSYLIFSPLLAFLSCSSADFLPTFSFFSRLERDFAKPQPSAPSSEEQEEQEEEEEEEETLTWRCDSRLKTQCVWLVDVLTQYYYIQLRCRRTFIRQFPCAWADYRYFVAFSFGCFKISVVDTTSLQCISQNKARLSSSKGSSFD